MPRSFAKDSIRANTVQEKSANSGKENLMPNEKNQPAGKFRLSYVTATV
jgi:hypothetical protein